MKDATVRRLSRLHRALYRMTGGVVGRRLAGNDMLLLTTTGRRSNRNHTVPLLCLGDGRRLVVVASYGGRDRDPAWYRNLEKHPTVTVQVGRRRFPAAASTASSEEREAWWGRIVRAYPGYADYQERTDREIPVVFLDPID